MPALITDTNGNFVPQCLLPDGSNFSEIKGQNGAQYVSTYSTIPKSATLQNAATATGNGTDFTVDGYGVARLQIIGTFVATVTFYGSVDGTNFHPIPAKKEADGTTVYTTTSTGIYEINCGALQKIRAAVTWTSGTSITIVGRAVALAGNNSVTQLSGRSLLVYPMLYTDTPVSIAAGASVFSEDGSWRINNVNGYPFFRFALNFNEEIDPTKIEVYYEDANKALAFSGVSNGMAKKVNILSSAPSISTSAQRIIISDGDIPIYNEDFKIIIKNIGVAPITLRQVCLRLVS